jgi:hypothetical protein
LAGFEVVALAVGESEDERGEDGDHEQGNREFGSAGAGQHACGS